MSFCPGSNAPVVNWFEMWAEIWNWILFNSSSSFIVRYPCPPPTIVPSLSHKPKFYHDLVHLYVPKARAPNFLLSAFSPGSNPSQKTLVKARCQELFCPTCSSALCHFTQHKSPKTTRISSPSAQMHQNHPRGTHKLSPTCAPKSQFSALLWFTYLTSLPQTHWGRDNPRTPSPYGIMANKRWPVKPKNAACSTIIEKIKCWYL